jgi:peroxiredoxin
LPKDSVPPPTLAEQVADFQLSAHASHPIELVTLFEQNALRLGATLSERGPKVGSVAPHFVLPDATGRQVALGALLGQGPVVLSFYRGGWCPYCNLELRAYQRALPEMQALGATLVAISPQTPDSSLSTAEKNELAFSVLSDRGNVVARAYDLVHTIEERLRPLTADLREFNGDESWELPIPGTFVLDRDGVVVLAYTEGNHHRRLEPAAILDALRRLRPA